MAKIAVKIKVLPESTDVDLTKLKAKCTKEIESYGGIVRGVEEQPIAFGLVALVVDINFLEQDGLQDHLEEVLAGIEGVSEIEALQLFRL